jgi:hypothetical protein
MGYQESYMRMKNNKDFNKLVECIKEYGKDKFDCAAPVEIITLLKPIKGDLSFQCRPDESYKFKTGEKFIYVVGERYNQRNPYKFFENCENPSEDILNDIEIYFTECFPSDDIFENNETTKMAKHKSFWEDTE